jgi:hypothetical protein
MTEGGISCPPLNVCNFPEKFNPNNFFSKSFAPSIERTGSFDPWD